MKRVGRNDPCPCGSGRKYKQCCGPAVEGREWPATPEALMRSRFTAYAVGAAEHLYRTTHSENEAVRGVERERFCRETKAYCELVEFERLVIHGSLPPDQEGVAQVHFTAFYRTGQEAGAFTERSSFLKVGGRWLYWKGEHEEEAQGP